MAYALLSKWEFGIHEDKIKTNSANQNVYEELSTTGVPKVSWISQE